MFFVCREQLPILSFSSFLLEQCPGLFFFFFALNLGVPYLNWAILILGVGSFKETANARRRLIPVSSQKQTLCSCR